MLLVGAGHAHALVLRRWEAEGSHLREGSRQVSLTVVTDRPGLVYSGMIPGVVAEEYAAGEAIVDTGALARRAGARFLVATVTEIDAEGRRVRLADGTSVGYDVASLDIGATVRGRDRSGPAEGAVSPRDVDGLVARLRALEGLPGSPSVVVVGGGAAGVELAAAIRGRLGRRFSFADTPQGDAPADHVPGRRPSPGGAVTLVEGAPHLMTGYSKSVSHRVRRALEARGVEVRTGEVVERIEGVRDEHPDTGVPASLLLSSGHRLTSHLTVWATGAAAPPLLAGSHLPTDDDGFVLVDDRLLVRGRDDLFAVGDCARFESRNLPKAGVHAVRQAPVLFENLRRVATNRGRDRASRHRARDLGSYEPQENFLTLLNLGDGTALGTKWGLVVEGRWVRWLKDAIDRRFVEGLRDPA